MLGIDYLVAGTLLTLAAGQQPQQAQSANLCPLVKAAEINVVPGTKPVRYDYSKTLQQLQSKDMDTINPYGFHGVTMTQGYMEGKISIKPSIKLGNKYDPRTGGVCLWYDKISVPVEIEPVIVIAKEVYNDSCMRKAVLEHEMKHVNVDRKIVNSFSRNVGAKIYKALEERGFRTQPVAPENTQAMADRMYSVITQTIEFEYKKMDLDRMERQNAVDSLQEYERMSSLCPDFQKKVPAASYGGKAASSKKRRP